MDELNRADDFSYFFEDGWIHMKFVELSDKFKGGNFTELTTGQLKYVADSDLGYYINFENFENLNLIYEVR